MKIISWNVNGLRALLNKNGWDWIGDQNPDVIGIQEVRARRDQLTTDQLANFSVYKEYWNPAEKPGYSGVLTLTSFELDEVIKGLGIPRFDSEGRITEIHTREIVIFNVYFPNGQRGHDRLSYKLDFYSALLDRCEYLEGKGKGLIIMGDFNTAHQEIDLARPKENKNTSGFMQVERDWVQNYLDFGLMDIFRDRNPDKVQYTWWTYRMNARSRNVGWRLDYFLVSKNLAARVKDVTIHDKVIGSDHCPVSITID